jgi:hypothetical protein
METQERRSDLPWFLNFFSVCVFANKNFPKRPSISSPMTTRSDASVKEEIYVEVEEVIS